MNKYDYLCVRCYDKNIILFESMSEAAKKYVLNRKKVLT